MTEEELKNRTFISELLMKKQSNCAKYAGNIFDGIVERVKEYCKDHSSMNTVMIAVDMVCKSLEDLLHDDDSPLNKSDKHKLFYGIIVYLVAMEKSHNENYKWSENMDTDPSKDYFKEGSNEK